MIINTITGKGSGESASIFVTGLSQTDSVSMVTPSGKTSQGVWGSKEVLEPYTIPILTSNDSRVISNNNSSEAWQVFDSNYQTGWNGGKGVANAWVGFNTTLRTVITNIYLDWTYVGSAYWTGFDGEFQVSDDGINWTKVQDIVSTGFTISVDFDSPIEGRYFRLLWHRVNSSYSGGHSNIYTISGNGYSVATAYGWIFDNLTEYGNYVITASNGTKTKTQNVLVDEATEFNVEMYYEGLRLYWDGKKYENWAVRPTQVAVTEFKELTDHFEVKSLYSSGSRKYGYAQIWMPDLLDFTGYSTIKVLVKASASSYFGLVKSDGAWVNGYVSFSNGQYAELTQNITDISGKEQSITIGTNENSLAVTLYVQRVWLE